MNNLLALIDTFIIYLRSNNKSIKAIPYRVLFIELDNTTNKEYKYYKAIVSK